MKTERWNGNWKFWPDRNAFALVWNVPEDAREITLPHDAMIETPAYGDSPNKGNTGYRDGGNYTYVKTFFVPEGDPGKYIVKFEGVYAHALVYVNQQLAGTEANGYAGFYVDLTGWLRPGEENELRVQVKNAGMTNSRWYSGSGIYRDVYLLRSGPVYIEPDSVQVTTESADEEYAVLSVKTAVINETAAPKELCLSTAVTPQKDGGLCAGSENTVFFLKPGEKRTITQRILVKSPALWSEDHPALYVCKSSLLEASGDTPLDTASDTFGIRTLTLDAARGLRVNGVSVKLRGACIHHDSGIIGAATYEDAHFRQIKRLKEAGFNAIRMSHHPAAPALLRVCDALGVYVMDEFSDMWSRAKSDLDYAMDFSRWWETDVALMVKKNFNHPSVVLYSVGNEIPEIGTDAGSAICAAISGRIKELDPTRFTTAGINGIFAAGDQVDRILADLTQNQGETGGDEGNVNTFMAAMDSMADQIVNHDAITKRLEKACAPLDVAGYNYMTARYEPDMKAYPNRVLVGSETYPPEIARNWPLVEKLPALIGDFTWTGWDYIGEAGIGVPGYAPGEGGFNAVFPCQLAYCGDLDITGFRRPLSYFREIVFGFRKDPYIAVQPPEHFGETVIKNTWIMSDATATWDWRGREGKPVVVEVYAPGDEVELIVNGKSCGRRPAGPAAGFRTLFETTYEPGTIQAAAYLDGREIGTFALHTAGEMLDLKIEKDFEGKELLYLALALTDGDGNVATDRDELLTAEVTGAELLGFGSGNPKPLHNYNEGKTETWNGRAQMILRKTAGQAVRVTVTDPSGKQAHIEIPAEQ